MTGPEQHNVRHNEDEIQRLLRLNQILGLRARGIKPDEIAFDLNLSVEYVEKALKRAVEQQRAAIQERVAERFETAEIRLEALWAIVQKHLEIMLVSGVFDDKIVKAAIMIEERRSRLWDLDRAKRGSKGAEPGRNLNDWLEKATPAELAAKAREYGLQVPDPFDLEAPDRERPASANAV